jgi:hypothetical protein
MDGAQVFWAGPPDLRESKAYHMKPQIRFVADPVHPSVIISGLYRMF